MASDSADRPDIDSLVAELRARVEARRAAGEYPPGLEESLEARFRHLLRHRITPARPFDVRAQLARMAAALPLQRARIPLSSARPAAGALHRIIARAVARQTEGILQQVQDFAEPAGESITALAEAVERLDRTLRDEVIPALDAVIERQAAAERAAAAAAAGEAAARGRGA
ncbi:MAG TPA: hypothetical protein VFE55_13145 [Acidimicrobiia bacterium]|nr:hypothetical protein [Acidimicrobiia bacterium]